MTIYLDLHKTKILFSTGFEVISELVSDVRVPMWYLIKKNKHVSKYSINITDQQDLFDKHSSDIKNFSINTKLL